MNYKKLGIIIGGISLLIVLYVILHDHPKPSLYERMMESPLFSQAFDAAGVNELHRAVIAGNVEHVKKLLEQGAEASSKAVDGTTPLHLAAGSGDKKCVEVLISAGANIETKDNKGNTPLFSAIIMAQSDIVELLLTNGAYANTRNKEGLTAMECLKKCEYNMTQGSARRHPMTSGYLKNLKKCERILKEHESK